MIPGLKGRGRWAGVVILASFLAAAWFLLLPQPLPRLPFGPSLPPLLTNPGRFGQWDPPIPVPLVPAAAALRPRSGRVLLWAADARTTFESDGNTITATVDVRRRDVSAANVSATHHNMFCPGLSLSSNGRVFVTGGSSSDKFSIYDEDEEAWIEGPPLKLGRGYHAQVTLADGRIFTIGGSWSGSMGGKNGEIFDSAAGAWTTLPGCSSEVLLTNDNRGAFTSDNHAWLFAWSDNSVFQAGPSSAMNWFDVANTGRTIRAGYRDDDSDSMNGNAIMYDALRGKILTLGGAQSYSGAPATSNAHIITLGEPFTPPRVERLDNMHSARVYANSVILPTGDVFINGGATWAQQWTDANATWVPEIWSSRTHRFTEMARMQIPRTYHSFALLLPDATVLVGGGGLCWIECEDESINHENVQVFRPPYLFTDRGRPAERPRILEVSTDKVSPGEQLLVTTDTWIVELVLIRYASATHSINTDQRRIKLRHEPLNITKEGEVETWNHSLTLPSDPGVMPPGYWMLFAVNTQDTPSLATTILVQI
ncbi:putative galactose oxidase precursor [Stachybotrys elegans]|uniref:Galactose oxidase n=1 Tax=Stachybotrys elegans TaxID=80388 RepID=A0A8K0SMV6_9HYPO|nr:putative galactose oxidase precursor [Stachybotrys elegans]